MTTIAKAKTTTIRRYEDMTWTAKSQSQTVELERKPEEVKELAEAFCELHDEDQADFFIKCSELGKEWDRDQADQWFAVGRHLEICECATKEARDMIKALRAGLINS